MKKQHSYSRTTDFPSLFYAGDVDDDNIAVAQIVIRMQIQNYYWKHFILFFVYAM